MVRASIYRLAIWNLFVMLLLYCTFPDRASNMDFNDNGGIFLKEDEINSSILRILDKYQYIDVQMVKFDNDQQILFIKLKDRIVSIYIDVEGNSSFPIETTPLYQLVEYQALAVNGALSDMLKFDPEGQYLFLFAGRNDLPRVSQHFTSDGYYLVIKYDHDGKIDEMKYYSVFP